MRRFSFGLGLALLFAATSAMAQDIPPLGGPRDDRTPLATAITRYFQLGSMRDTNDYRAALVDLNGDGRDDAVVIVEGPSWCASGGCTLLVFRGTPSGFQFVSRSMVSEAPVRVSSRKVNGWKMLIVHTRGVGDVQMAFDGKGYPVNPAVQFLVSASEVAAARILLNR